jgi:hypothetical protein
LAGLTRGGTGLNLQQWRSLVQKVCPAGTEFQAQAIRFSYSDVRRMIKFIFDALPYHEDFDDGTEFACAAYVRSYAGATLSTWIMIAKIKPVKKQ